MRVIVDPSLCQAYANCVMTAPAVFALDDAAGTAVVLLPDPPAELQKAVEEAVALCPVRAITADAGDAAGDQQSQPAASANLLTRHSEYSKLDDQDG